MPHIWIEMIIHHLLSKATSRSRTAFFSVRVIHVAPTSTVPCTVSDNKNIPNLEKHKHIKKKCGQSHSSMSKKRKFLRHWDSWKWKQMWRSLGRRRRRRNWNVWCTEDRISIRGAKAISPSRTIPSFFLPLLWAFPFIKFDVYGTIVNSSFGGGDRPDHFSFRHSIRRCIISKPLPLRYVVGVFE